MPCREHVPGVIVIMSRGDILPAGAELLSGQHISIDESTRSEHHAGLK